MKHFSSPSSSLRPLCSPRELLTSCVVQIYKLFILCSIRSSWLFSVVCCWTNPKHFSVCLILSVVLCSAADHLCSPVGVQQSILIFSWMPALCCSPTLFICVCTQNTASILTPVFKKSNYFFRKIVLFAIWTNKIKAEYYNNKKHYLETSLYINIALAFIEFGSKPKRVKRSNKGYFFYIQRKKPSSGLLNLH